MIFETEEDKDFAVSLAPFRMAGQEKPDYESRHPSSKERQESMRLGGISDQPIESAKNDTLGFEPYVDAVATFLTDDSTKPPLTMSIEGEWGSGKSSFMKVLIERLQSQNERVIEFNAWRHDKADSLWSAFALQLNRKLSHAMPIYRRIWAALILFSRRFRLLEGWFDAVRMLVLAIFIFVGGWVVWSLSEKHGSEATQRLLESITKEAPSPTPVSQNRETSSQATTHSVPPLVTQVATSPTANSQSNDTATQATIKSVAMPLHILSIAAAFALLLSFLTKFKALFGNPFAIDLTKYARSPKYNDQISFIEQFHDDFAKIVATYVRKNERIFLFIDDLDRCEVPKAADLVQGLNLLVSDIPNFIFVIGMDREKVAAALAIKFESALPYLAPKLRTANQSIADSALGGLAFGYEFIEKFVQVPFRIPQPVNEMARFFRSLSNDNSQEEPTPPPSDEPEKNAFALEVKNDSPTVRQIGLALAKTFDYNPRRLKQFLSLFRLQAFIAFKTGLFGGSEPLTLEQLGKFVAISIRWPLLFSEIGSNPNLLLDLEDIAAKRAPTRGTEVFEQAERFSALPAKGPFDQWTDNNELEEFFLVGRQSSKTIPPQWSFATVDISKLLRVSPPAQSPLRGSTSQPESSVEEINPTKERRRGIWPFRNDLDEHRKTSGKKEVEE